MTGSWRSPPSFPAQSFALLIVEGGDERAVCERVVGASAWNDIVCVNARGTSQLVAVATLLARQPNFTHARSVGVVLDTEGDLLLARALAADVVGVFGAPFTGHATLSSGPRPTGAFLSPDGAALGSIETLCRRALRHTALADCVDELVRCAGYPHALGTNPVATADKAWVNAYLSMLIDPDARFHQAFGPLGIDPAHQAFESLRTFLTAL